MIGDLSDKVPDETPMFRLYTGPDQEPETGVVAAGRGCGELQKPLFVERHFRRAGRQQPWRLAKRLGRQRIRASAWASRLAERLTCKSAQASKRLVCAFDRQDMATKRRWFR